MRSGVLFLSVFARGFAAAAAGAVFLPRASRPAARSTRRPDRAAGKPSYVELLNDKRRGRNVFHTTIVAYLLQPDQKSAVAQQVKSVTIKLGAPPGEQTVNLRSDPDRSDPVGSARFVSEMGPFQLDQTGVNPRVLDGKTLTTPFRGPDSVSSRALPHFLFGSRFRQ